ncbi:MAG: AAA family ATPase [Candidatus Geothermincolia bacterium]
MENTPLIRITEALERCGSSVKQQGDQYIARCPAHSDRKASLSVKVGEDGKVLLKCHAGCETTAIVAAIGLDMGDLFPASTRKVTIKPHIVATYQYRDESGALLFESVRFNPKDFRQRRPTKDGKDWVWNLKDVRLVPYRLPELIAAVGEGKTIYIVEGEKDVETLRSWGLAATCNPMGAGKWSKVNDVAAKVLHGARVVIIPDDDETGRKHAQEIWGRLGPAAASVQVLPPFVGAKDVTGWMERGGTQEQLESMVVQAKTWKPTAASEFDLDTITDEELERKEISPLRWIIPGFIPEGLSILVGNPKVGKSALVLGWGYSLPQGLPIMGKVGADLCEVLYLALEDNNRRVKERIGLLRDGNPPSKGLHYITLDSRTPFRRLDSGGAEQIEQHLDKHPYCRLVIIDTWSKVKPWKRNKSQQEYDADSAAWSILHSIATKRRIAIVVLHHTRKPLKVEGDWTMEISGTSGIAGTVDTILLFRRIRGEKTATILVAGRDLDEEKEYILHGDPRTKRWTLGEGNAEELKLSQAQRDVIKVLRTTPHLFPKEIAATLGMDDSSKLRPILHRMTAAGRILLDTHNRYYLSSTFINESNESNEDNGSNDGNGSNSVGATSLPPGQAAPPIRPLRGSPRVETGEI